MLLSCHQKAVRNKKLPQNVSIPFFFFYSNRDYSLTKAAKDEKMLREDWSQRVDLASVLNATQHSMHRYDSNQMQLFTMWELCIRNWQTFVKVLLNLKLRPCFAFRDCICHYSVSTYLTHRFEMEMEMRCCTMMCCAVLCGAVILQITKSGCDSAASRERKK